VNPGTLGIHPRLEPPARRNKIRQSSIGFRNFSSDLVTHIVEVRFVAGGCSYEGHGRNWQPFGFGGIVDLLLKDLLFGLRLLRRSPGFTAIAVLILALAIGANTTIFSAVNAVLLRTLPYPQSSRLVQLFFTIPGDNFLARFLGSPKLNFAYADFQDIRSQQQVFEEMAAYRAIDTNFKSDQGPERLVAANVSEGFFPLLGVDPLLGRGFLQEDFAPSNNRVVMLSHGLWQRHFADEPDVIGKDVTLDGISYTVVGVMRADFCSIPTRDWRVRSGLIRTQLEPQIWTPLLPSAGDWDRGSMQFDVIGRLKPTITLARAQSDLDLIAHRIQQQFPHDFKVWGIEVELLHAALRGRYRTLLLILQGAVGLVLLIAAVNIANLLLNRAAGRQRELAIRASLGADHKRIICQLLTESVLLSLLGGGLGLLLAYVGNKLLNAFLPAVFIGVPLIRIDTHVLLFVCLLSMLTGAALGTVPALLTLRINLNAAVRPGQILAGRFNRHRLSRLLVVAQVSLTLALLVASGLLARTCLYLWNLNPGCQTRKILTMRISFTDEGPQDNRALVAYFRRVLERVPALPGVESAGLVAALPTTGNFNNSTVSLEGRPDLQKNPVLVLSQPTSARYFQTMGIPLRQGRLFSEQDDENAPLVTLISETMVRRFWQGQNPVGRRVYLGGKHWTIVGVVGDVRQEDLVMDYRCAMYMPYPQYPAPSLTLAVRTAVNPLAMSLAVREAIYSIDARHPVSQIRTMETVIGDGLLSLRLFMFLISTMAGLALLVALLGIYGVLANVVGQRTQEIGVRMALGARRRDVLKIVLQQGMTPVLLGIGIGVILSLGITRILASQLYGVTPTDPATFIGVSLALFGAATLACALPAGRAARVDPLVALKHE
jgi:putative ABC transport system permease protein